MSTDAIRKYVESNSDRMIAELRKAVQQPSISAQNLGVLECAHLLQEMLESRGFETRLVSEGSQPHVFAERRGRSDKTLLYYNHYDVQPPEPLDAWISPPFDAEIRDGKIWGRGVSDHKGSLLARIHGIDAVLATEGELPVTIKFLLDGEEEFGSPTLPTVVRNMRELLRADYCLYCGGGKNEHGIPTVRCGHRGAVYLELTCQGANQDLHDRWSSLVPNPAVRLVNALASLTDETGRITIAGYHDDCEPVSDADMEALRSIRFDTAKLKANWGLTQFVNDAEGLKALKQYLFTPNFSIQTLTSGYQGRGMQITMPCTATAKIGLLMIPNQRTGDILEKLKRNLEGRGFGDIVVKTLGLYDPARTPVDHPFVKAVVDSTRRAYECEPALWPIWGGMGTRYLFSGYLGIPTVVDTGVTNWDGRHHAPNENVNIVDYLQNVVHMADLVAHLA